MQDYEISQAKDAIQHINQTWLVSRLTDANQLDVDWTILNC